MIMVHDKDVDNIEEFLQWFIINTTINAGRAKQILVRLDAAKRGYPEDDAARSVPDKT